MKRRKKTPDDNNPALNSFSVRVDTKYTKMNVFRDHFYGEMKRLHDIKFDISNSTKNYKTAKNKLFRDFLKKNNNSELSLYDSKTDFELFSPGLSWVQYRLTYEINLRGTFNLE